MSLRAAIAAELPFLRAEAEALMVDTCVVRRPNGKSAQNETTGTVTPLYDDLFTSACKVQSRALVATDVETGDRTATVVRVSLHLPITTADLLPDDVAEVTAVGPLSRTRVGRLLRIMAPVDKTWPTALRYEVEDVVK